MIKWIAGGIGALCLTLFTFTLSALDQRLTALEASTTPKAERLAVVETKIDNLTMLVEEIRNFLAHDRPSASSPTSPGGRAR